MTTASGIAGAPAKTKPEASQSLGRRIFGTGPSLRRNVLYGAAALLTGMAIGGSVWAVSIVRDVVRAAPAVATAGPTAPNVRADATEAAAEPATETGKAEPIAPPPPALRPPPPPPITLELNADLGAQRLKVIENGAVKYTWPISSGRSGFETKTGTFRPQWASRMWYSRQYDAAPMPHAVFFHQGMAFHATNAIGLLGRPASHGCIRLSPGNAAQLFKLVHKHSFAGTKIIVHHGSRNKAPPIAAKSNPKRDAKAAPREAPGAVDRRAKSRVAAR